MIWEWLDDKFYQICSVSIKTTSEETKDFLPSRTQGQDEDEEVRWWKGHVDRMFLDGKASA